MDNEIFILGIIVPLISSVVGGCISLLIMRILLKQEKVKSKRERIIYINNDKIKSYKELFELNKSLKLLEIKLKIIQFPIG